jgi:hypothetical protein
MPTSKGDGGPPRARRPYEHRIEISVPGQGAARLSIPTGPLTGASPGAARHSPHNTPHRIPLQGIKPELVGAQP